MILQVTAEKNARSNVGHELRNFLDDSSSKTILFHYSDLCFGSKGGGELSGEGGARYLSRHVWEQK